MTQPVRGTQTLVDQMGWVMQRPTLVLLEIAWRWIFGIPFLWVCWTQAHRIFAALPLESAGLANLDAQNPWVAAVQLADAWARYEPSLRGVIVWLAPLAAAAWIVAAGLGRSLLLARLEPGLKFRPLALTLLQAAWFALQIGLFALWFLSMQWAAASHISGAGEPDLVGYSVWAIFLSLGFFTLAALVSWPLSIAPLLMLLERRSAASSLIESLRLGKAFTGKLMETNLVMGIVKLALVVLAMVFSAAPLPFSDQLGPESLHVVWAGATVFYLVANDYFHVVRLKGFIEFWRSFRA